MSTPTTEDHSIQGQYKKGPIDVVKHFWIYISISLLVTIPGLIVMGMSMKEYPNHAPMRMGIDFTGGTLLQYGFLKPLNQEEDIAKMRHELEEAGISNPVIQLQQAEKNMTGEVTGVTTKQIVDEPENDKTPVRADKKHKESITEMFKDAEKQQGITEKMGTIKSIVSIRTQDLTSEQTITLQKTLQDSFGEFVLLQKNRVGPTLAKELFIKAGWGLLLAYALIVGYLTIRFQLDYAITAIVALIHDTIFMLGMFSILGWYYHIEVDSMFMTAILTAVGFSVHDTIVVFDRIRENARVLYTKKLPFSDIVNISVNQTVARSINTSLTALLTLLALFFLGGESTRHFVLAMLLGIITGTYSSIFVASSLLAWWRGRKGEKSRAGSTQPRAA